MSKVIKHGLVIMAVVVLVSGCEETSSPKPAESVVPVKNAVCSTVGETAKDAKGKTLMCYRESGDLLPRWNEG
jgi:hypothetical protein